MCKSFSNDRYRYSKIQKVIMVISCCRKLESKFFSVANINVKNLKVRLCPIGASSWKLIFNLCSTQWTPLNIVVRMWQKGYHYLWLTKIPLGPTWLGLTWLFLGSMFRVSLFRYPHFMFQEDMTNQIVPLIFATIPTQTTC